MFYSLEIGIVYALP